jgi:hypothetical protein
VLGVVVLVGAATFAAGVETTGPSRSDRATDVAVDRLTAASSTAVREAVRDAAREAALRPVTTPANTTVGRALDEERPFRDALRLRIYVRSRAYLATASHERNGVRATASLPATTDTAAIEDALSRVRIRPVDNGTALQVRIRNVSVRATRAGRTVVATNRTLNVTVATPVLAMHDRAEAYERRLDRDALEGPGLGRQVTARLFAVAWARGYAQHAGAPIEEVLATRHVEVATNDAVLRTQRATFGRADPVARRQLAEAAVRAGLADVAEPTPVDGNAAWAWDDASGVAVPAGSDDASVPSPDASIPIRVGDTADRAAVHAMRSDRTGPYALDGALRAAYRANASLRTVVDVVEREDRPSPASPGSGWEQVDSYRRVEATVSDASGPLPAARGQERLAARFARRVERRHTVGRTWAKGNHTTTTEVHWRETYRVGVAVVVAHAPNGGAPDRAVRPLFERGGALDGRNLAGTPAMAAETLVDGAGGRDRVAADVVAGDAGTSASVYGERPGNLSRWVRRDVVRLNSRVRNVSTNVSGTAIGTMRVNPAAELAAELRANRAELVDAPATYDGVADRARVAARARYLDAVLDRLDARAARFDRMRRAYGRSLAAEDVESPSSLATRVAAGRNASAAGPPVIRGNLSNATLSPQVAPAYLTTEMVSHEQSPAVPRRRAYHPLATRNVNLFTVPYEDAAAAVSGAVVEDPERVHLGSAGRALRVANLTLRSREDAKLRRERDRLQAAVESALRPVERRAGAVLARTTRLPPAARRRVVAEAGEDWTTAGRARAAANGSLAAAIAAEAADRGGVDAETRATLTRRLRVETADAVGRRDATVSARQVASVGTHARRLASEAAAETVARTGERATDRAAEEWVGEAFAAVPSGLPVVPPPYTWYATVNVWTVTVEGAYARFSLRSTRDAPGGSLRYVREGAAATLDVDGDGTAELLGHGERVGFETRTAVFVVVPANGRGVGDVGVAEETSPGWPGPSCTAPLSQPCPAE